LGDRGLALHPATYCCAENILLVYGEAVSRRIENLIVETPRGADEYILVDWCRIRALDIY
jgi:hypothetical protein